LFDAFEWLCPGKKTMPDRTVAIAHDMHWASGLPRKLLAGVVAQVKKRYGHLKERYGPRYTRFMLGAAFFALFSPIPGSVLIVIALVVAVAETHRAISKSLSQKEPTAPELAVEHRDFPEGFGCCSPQGLGAGPASGKLLMEQLPRDPRRPVYCDVILKWTATPEQLTALGAAFWRWCTGAAGNAGIYQFLDNQDLADLMAGTLPASNPGDRRGSHFRVLDRVSHNRQKTIDSLRHDIPFIAVEDIVVEGISWKLCEAE
jgi:hypothetical protein